MNKKKLALAVSAAAAAMGKIGGSKKSEAKTLAARANAKKPRTKKSIEEIVK